MALRRQRPKTARARQFRSASAPSAGGRARVVWQLLDCHGGIWCPTLGERGRTTSPCGHGGWYCWEARASKRASGAANETEQGAVWRIASSHGGLWKLSHRGAATHPSSLSLRVCSFSVTHAHTLSLSGAGSLSLFNSQSCLSLSKICHLPARFLAFSLALCMLSPFPLNFSCSDSRFLSLSPTGGDSS